ncbi:unnamed protein product [Effrenium voratum]|nr:unnamed protein product [Effrenium voratum]
MPTWRQLAAQAWEGTVACQNACVVRAEPDLESEKLADLAPGTAVTVLEEQTASGRLRYRLGRPVEGWVTAKYVRQKGPKEKGEPPVRADNGDWKPLGETTFFPDSTMKVSDKTPMGYPVDIFQGQDVDVSFGSPAAMYRDRVEMAMWVARRVGSYKDSLGEEVNAMLMAEHEPSQQRVSAPGFIHRRGGRHRAPRRGGAPGRVP